MQKDSLAVRLLKAKGACPSSERNMSLNICQVEVEGAAGAN